MMTMGAWGTGTLTKTVSRLMLEPGITPVVACGRNPRTPRQLRRMTQDQAGRAVVLDWIDDMSRIFAACDVVVQNAGGLMAMEAAAMGLPLFSAQCLPGHGTDNAQLMHDAGIAWVCHSDDELLDALKRGGFTDPQRSAELFDNDPVSLLVESFAQLSERLISLLRAGDGAQPTA